MMKLTVAALALLVAGASYADMAAAWDAPLKEALFNSGEVYGFRHGCSLGTNKEKCTGLVFGNHENGIKATYTAQRYSDDDRDTKETFKVHGADHYSQGGVDGFVDKMSGTIKVNNGKGDGVPKGKITDKYNYAGDKGKKVFKCEGWHGGFNCGWQ